MKVSNLYYLVHSMIYSGMAADDPQRLRDSNAGIYLERELLCEKRWRAAIRQLPPDAIYAQLYGGPDILPFARDQLGDGRVIAPSAEFTAGMDGELYKQMLTDSFRAQLTERGHELDPQTTQLEAWGESFTGCAYGYGTSLNRQLGLAQPAYVNFDLCVPDERQLCKAELITHFLLPGTPVRGYVFDGPLGFSIGLFLEGFARQDAGQTGRIRLPIDCSKLAVESGNGITLHADLYIDRPDGRRIPLLPTRSDPDVTTTPDTLELPRGRSSLIMATHLSPTDLITAMQAATVTEQ